MSKNEYRFVLVLSILATVTYGIAESIPDFGMKGGIVAVIGCDEPAMIVNLKRNDSCIVHAIDTDAQKIKNAHNYIMAKGLYGPIAATCFSGKNLPYADNSINQIVIASDRLKVELDEIKRALTPRGTIIQYNGKTYKKVFQKPVPENIDDWSHHLHAADGNPVAQDTVVGSPSRIQWVCEPKWARHHDSDSSIDNLVSAGGRIFYMVDEAPPSLNGYNELPDKWSIVARDAFNGVLLWKQPIKDWGWRAWKANWGMYRMSTLPRNLHRRVVATKEYLYMTMGFHAPVSQLDAATGKILQTFANTERTREILYHNGQLILTVPGAEGKLNKVLLLNPTSGETIWETTVKYAGARKERDKKDHMKEPYSALNAAVNDNAIYIMDKTDIVCLDRSSGEEKWRSVATEKELYAGTLIISNGVVLYAEMGMLTAFSADKGEVLWTSKMAGHSGTNWYPWKDVFVIDGLVWTWGNKGAHSLDIKTGEKKNDISVGNLYETYHHHRCYRNKATSRYIITSRRGTEYIDLKDGKHSVHIWNRGICHFGMMPANGYLYAPPSPCRCYSEEKLNGFYALASGSNAPALSAESEKRLIKGEAYESIRKSIANSQSTENTWDTFRGDAERNGSTDTELPALQKLWTLDLGGNITAPIVVEDKTFVAEIDEHTVHAIDRAQGKRLWQYVVGGRVNTPPTFYKGMIVVGSADGWVTCLQASDGKLVWKFQAALMDRILGVYNQLESAWPVHGSVLVDKTEGTVYLTAGRSSYLDGGIQLYGLDAGTGQVKYHTVVDGPHPDLSQEDWHRIYVKGPFGVGSRSDILQLVDGRICMGSKVFTKDLKPYDEPIVRIRMSSSMLDDSQYRRAYWFYGDVLTANLEHELNQRPVKELKIEYGRGDMLVCNKKNIYSAVRFDDTVLLNPRNHFVPGRGDRIFSVEKGKSTMRWESRIPVRVRSMLVANDKLICSGPREAEPDKADPLASYEFRKGGVLWIMSEATGEKLAEHELEAPPIYNGLAAADGRLYISQTDGKIICMGEQ